MVIHAHSLPGQDEARWETLEQHSTRVAEAARRRGEPAGLGSAASLLGLVHDLGKAKPAFQARLRGSMAAVSHSGEGARLLHERGGVLGQMLAGAVAGHHGRLPNPDRLRQRIADAEMVDAPGWLAFAKPDIPGRLLEPGLLPDARAFRAQFLVRFLYGCLTDADDRETAAWEREMRGDVEPPRPVVLSLDMQDTFDRHVGRFTADTPVNLLRAQVLAHVRSRATETPGLFTLTVPTGGGKTLASLGFALDHAARHGMTRLIHVAPFTSIVEQTADVFREVLGPETVLEHHSAFEPDSVEGDDEREQRRVAGASWDAPVVVTTAVKFFESLFAARKKRCRKLPSLAKAVIVVDEAQTMPRAFLRPCLAALTELVEGYGASVVLCTATQPALTVEAGFPKEQALKGARELAPDPSDLHERLRRVRVRDLDLQTDEELAARLRDAAQALLIVDNRRQARRLFDAVVDAEGAMHLSTLMTAGHRRHVLTEVRARLKAREPVRLISTSLVEAGVDVDFPLVMRAAAGIDSLAQAAGRCNREGKMECLGEMLVFRTEHRAPAVVEDYAAKGREVLARHPDDPLSPAAVTDYFDTLWRSWGPEALDSAEVGGKAPIRGILQAITKGGSACPFEDIESAFRLIGEEQRAVVIRDGEHGAPQVLLDRLQWGSSGTAARTLQPFTVNVPFGLWRDLWAAGVLAWWRSDRFGEQFALLEAPALYHPRAGLNVADFDKVDALFA